MGKRADNVIEFIETFCTLKETGKPFLLEPWQRKIVRGVYPDRVGGERTITRGVVSTARKNAKTIFAAAQILAHLTGPEAIPGTGIIGVATSIKQARHLFGHASRMVRAHPQLRKRIEIKASEKSMLHKDKMITYETLSSRAATAHGENIAFWVYDELAQAGGLDLYDALEKAQGAVPGGGLGMIISTYSSDPGNPLADIINMVDTGQQVGGMRHWHTAIYSSDPNKDMYDWDNIKKANPNLGVSCSVASVEKEIEEAKASPLRRADYRAYRLNQNTGIYAQLCDPLVWHAAAAPKPEAEMLSDLAGESCTLGLDLSDTRDLTSLGIWFEKHNFIASENWLPRDTLAEREAESRVPYREWAEQGWLQTIPGPVIRYEVIYRRLVELSTLFRVRSLRYDRYRMAPIVAALEKQAVSMEAIPFGQGYRDMSPAVETFENKLLSGELLHGKNPILTMAILNCKITENPTSLSDERKPHRLAKHHKIDPAVALLMAVADRGEAEPPTAESLFATGLVDNDLDHFLPEDDPGDEVGLSE